MAQRDSVESKRVTRDEVVEDEAPPTSSATPAELESEVDSILDEIDSVLEENAEDFVKSFVQKGGQ